RGPDPLVGEPATGHVTDPPTQQRVIERGDAEPAPEHEAPEVHRGGTPDADERDPQEHVGGHHRPSSRNVRGDVHARPSHAKGCWRVPSTLRSPSPSAQSMTMWLSQAIDPTSQNGDNTPASAAARTTSGMAGWCMTL